MNYPLNLLPGISFNEPLNKHTTFSIGPRARVWFEPKNISGLGIALLWAKERNIPVFVIGAGSNVLIRGKAINAVFIRLNSPAFKTVKPQGNVIFCGAGAGLWHLIKKTAALGLGGLEFLSGIPGTLGGALAMNAGISRRVKGNGLRVKEIGELVEDVTVMDYGGRIKTIFKENLCFDYRSSNLSRCIILSAHLKLFKKDKKKINRDIREYIARRRNAQDALSRSAGCIFKNPSPDKSAGRLIDLCGLKGVSRGDAAISGKHANFIINRAAAKAEDVLALMSLAKKKVKKIFGITLKPEIKIWP